MSDDMERAALRVLHRRYLDTTDAATREAIWRDIRAIDDMEMPEKDVRQLARLAASPGARHDVPGVPGETTITEDPEADGSLDDIAISANGVMLHVERMDTGHWWFALYTPDGTQHAFNLHSSRKITARYEPSPR